MAMANGCLVELSHQLRFLFFEMGISLSQQQVTDAITNAHTLYLSVLPNHPEQRKQLIGRQAMKQLYRQRWQTELSHEAFGYDNFWQWLNRCQNASQQLLLLWQWGNNDSVAVDSAVESFNFREILQYTPAFNSRVNLHWCAVQYDLNNEAQTNYLLQLERLFPHLLQEWRVKMRANHINDAHYLPLAIHPGHWRGQWQQQCAALIDRHELVLVPHHQTVRPVPAPGFLLPTQNDDCLMDINQQTSSSAHINKMLSNHNHFDGKLFVLDEIARLTLDNLPTSALLRNPLSLLQQQQSLIPLDALFTKSPLSKKPLLVEMIEISKQEPMAYFRLYCQRLLVPQLQLFIKEGVILSSTSSDTLLIIDHDLPHALVLCRLDSTINSDACATTLLHQFIRGNIDNNIARWIKVLHEYFQLPLLKLWQSLIQLLQEFLTNYPDKNEHFYALQANLLHSPDWRQNLLTNHLHVANEDMTSTAFQRSNPHTRR